jgi:hypothetical protein
MKRCFPVLCCCALVFFLIASFASVARAESYARVCVTSIDAGSQESVLTEDSSPASGKRLVVHLDASTECTALIVPLTEKGSRLANSWRPQMIVLPQWDERTLPNSRAAWEWNKSGEPFELWIFFFKRDTPGLNDIQKLVSAMQNPSLEERVLTQQTRLLCDKLRSRMTGSQQIMRGPKAGAALVGGAMRATEFPWRDYAQKVTLNDALEGTLVVRHGR